jgi:CxxC motif-containing protein (DUF1111 family)
MRLTCVWLSASLGLGALACGADHQMPVDLPDAPPPVDAGADFSGDASGGGIDGDIDGAIDAAPAGPSDELLAGGRATVLDATRNAFGQPVPGLAAAREDDFFVGNSLFNRGWVIAPASVVDMDGLGPVFNATNCSGCHLRDGRGRPPERPDEPFLSMLLRLSIPGAGPQGGPLPEPTYGGQLQGEAIPGVPDEGRARVTYQEVPGQFPDGEAYTLRQPRYEIEALGYGPMAPDVLISPRVAPHLPGLGLLEAIPEADLLALADPDDSDGDGISGRPNLVWDAAAGRQTVGRFGWKANQPSLRQQTAAAFNGDIGITSAMFPDEACTGAQQECRSAPPGSAGPQLRDAFLDSVIAYVTTLAVPARRRLDDAGVQRGKQLFAAASCDRCHVPTLHTGVHPTVPELSGQKIHPFTDLLVHDMGPALADGRPDFQASGSEWRTPPLWGLGLVFTVNRHRTLLHDGRARGFSEAILWHGGEAAASKEAFMQMPRSDREALIAFLESL